MKVKKARKQPWILGGALLLAGAAWIVVSAVRPGARAVAGSIDPDGIIRYIRERFGVWGNVKLTLSPLKDSALPGFEEGVVTMDDGKNTKTQGVLVSKDDRYLIVGNAQALSGDAKGAIAQHLREAFKLPANMQLTVGDFRKSEYPGLLETEVTAAEPGGKTQKQNFYVSGDEHMLVIGGIYSLAEAPRSQVMRSIVTEGQPSVGAANAKVTIVEYADLECPTCAALHKFLESEFLPKYGDRVRVIFKEFPLPGHDWSLTAAIANECAYQIDPAAFVKYRTSIFANQGSINAGNVRERVLALGEQAGINRSELAACVDSNASLARIEADRGEGQTLGVDRTPTSFINGRRVVGAPSPAEFDKMVDDALAGR